MNKWKEEFVGYTNRKCVHIHINGDYEHGKVLYLEPDWTYLDFLNAASSRLEMTAAAKRSFNSDGVEIDDCMMIEDNDILFLSVYDNFIPPADMFIDDGDAEAAGRVEGEKIPHNISGYKVGELLGRGGFGEVRVGEHQVTNEKVALKFLRKSEIHSLGAAERTNLEIQCLTALKHVNIIRLAQHMESQHHVILAFELMGGGDLLKYLLRRQKQMNLPKACLQEDEARHVFYQVVSAISYAHNQQIIHRDLKLENILLKDSTLALVKIADFGLSDFYRPGAVMKTNCGTLSFLAPEVFKGTANAGPPLDVWALGVILFALLCGRLPFEGPDLIGTKRPRDAVIKSRIMKCQFKIDETLGNEAKDLIRRMLQGDPAERSTIPEIFNHIWMRNANSSQFVDHFHMHTIATAAAAAATLAQNAETARKATASVELSAKELDMLIPVNHSPAAVYTNNSSAANSFQRAKRNSSTGLLKALDSEPVFFNGRVNSLNTESPSPASSGKFSFASDIDQISSSGKAGRRERRVGNSSEKLLDELLSGQDTPRTGSNLDLAFSSAADGKGNTGSGSNAPVEAKSTIKLIPLRRNNSNNEFKTKELDEFLSGGAVGGVFIDETITSSSSSAAGKTQTSKNIPRPSTVNTATRRQQPSPSYAHSSAIREDELLLSSAADSQNPNIAKKYFGSKKDIIHTSTISPHHNENKEKETSASRRSSTSSTSTSEHHYPSSAVKAQQVHPMSASTNRNGTSNNYSGNNAVISNHHRLSNPVGASVYASGSRPPPLAPGSDSSTPYHSSTAGALSSPSQARGKQFNNSMNAIAVGTSSGAGGSGSNGGTAAGRVRFL